MSGDEVQSFGLQEGGERRKPNERTENAVSASQVAGTSTVASTSERSAGRGCLTKREESSKGYVMNTWPETGVELKPYWRGQPGLKKRKLGEKRSRNSINSYSTSPVEKGKGKELEVEVGDKRSWSSSMEEGEEKAVLREKVREMEERERSLLERVGKLEEMMSAEESESERKTYRGTPASKVRRPDSPSDMVKTRALLSKYREDPDMVVQSIQAAPDGPPSFPLTEWRNIIEGRSVNLNAVLSGIYALRPVQESVGWLGPFEVRGESTESPKKVETAAQWISAWDETVQATSVAFPHREGELREYGREIRRLFDCVVVPCHSRVFAYDEAVRSCVRGGESLSLTDYNAFRHFFTAYILSFGAEVPSKGQSKGKGAEKQMCRGFNGKGCSYRNCRFRHVCGFCGESDHGQMECSKRKQEEESKA